MSAAEQRILTEIEHSLRTNDRAFATRIDRMNAAQATGRSPKWTATAGTVLVVAGIMTGLMVAVVVLAAFHI
ncbi:DUF3040 domain-containing protein [Herbidospora sp. NEAU-GS84]|uniref:DUF3040 domain-containing protein n=1 Tax=Herbidospora solisilvae TaxID=2696284 RepID=A0A7C9JF96_9ACTN|nr:DUF3040 domain-containing protein [Herbidospora solisilvae]NAS23603.1 DUF3040 domain-containing protein [Herbidospora solisilvae]